MFILIYYISRYTRRERKETDMKFYYKDKNGVIGLTTTIRDIPSGCKIIIVRRYDGRAGEIPYCDTLIVDASYYVLTPLCMRCNKLKIYNHRCNKLYIGNGSVINELARLDMTHITNMDSGLSCIELNKVCCIDFKNVKLVYKVFNVNNLVNIPDMINYEHLPLNTFDNNVIPETELNTWKTLMIINRKTI